MKKEVRLMKKTMIGLTMFAVASASAAITSRSYVPTGLVAQYDGINNVGHDAAHDDSAAMWVNLTGNTALDGTVASSVVWGADSWSVSTKCNPITVGNALSQITGTGTFTIQFACTPQTGANSGRQCFFSQFNASNAFGIEHNGTGISNSIRLYCAGQTSTSPVPGGESLVSMSGSMVVGKWVSASVTSDNGLRDVTFYTNLVACGERHYTTSKSLNKNCTSIIGGEPYVHTRDMAFRGTYNAFRVYNRVLTEDEIKVNAAVDAVRFNNKTWADFPELADYSFDNAGYLQANFIATATEGGNVKIDDGAASGTATATFTYGSAAQSHAFTAVPNSGYVFYRWEGDTDAIANGSYLSPTITVTAAKAVSLTAVFKATRRGLTSLSYVVPGLVALYDGIDNAGYGQHDGSTTTWADLSGNGNDGTCTNILVWSANGWSVSQNCKPVTVGNGISAVTGTGTFTIQFACTPQTDNKRQCFISQYDKDAAMGIGIEHNSGSVTDGRIRIYSRKYDKYVFSSSTSGKLLANEWATTTVASSKDVTSIAFWKNGDNAGSGTISVTKSAHETACPTVIGGEPWVSTRDMAFRGTFNACRVYSRVLTDDEVKVNSAVDAIRFNGASASSYTLGGGYSFAADSTLMIAMTATATTGGQVALKREGSFASTVSSAVNQDGTEIVGFVAQSEDGYIFQGWTGDVAAIVEGTILTPEIGVVETHPVTLTAVFRKPGNALDGMIFDLDIRDVEDDALMAGTSSGYHVGDALKAGSSSSNTYYTAWYTPESSVPGFANDRPKYRIRDIASPMTPFTTNAAQPCVYMTQKKDEESGKCGITRWELPYNYVSPPVATIYVRFLWEGPAVPGIANDSCILCNGYTTWANVGEGFTLRIRTPSGGGSNDNKGYLNVFIPKEVPAVDYGIDFCISSNSWVDCFVSVYPSPTNVELSNADIWFCQTPSLSGGVFGYPKLKHRHLGDECALPRFRSVASGHAMRLGAEHSEASSDSERIRKAFRGYYADIKAWNRVLSESEMWAVMSGYYGGTFNIGVENGNADEFGGPWYGTADPLDVSANKWQEMKKSLTADDRTLTLVAPIPAESEGLPRVLEIVPLFDGVGASCPVTVMANGVRVGEFDLMDASKRSILLRGNLVKRDANGKLTIAITRPEGCEGTLSFDALSLAGSWQIGTIDGTSGDMTQQGQGVSSVVIAGDPNYKHAQRAVTTTYNTLTIPFDVPKSSAGQCEYRYETSIDSIKPDNTHPIHLEFNGETVWSSANATKGKVRVEIPAEDIKAGLNELKWVYDTTTASNWLTFDYHRLKMMPPPLGSVLSVR